MAVGIVVALIGGFVPADYLWDTVSIGTLLAFIVVALGVIVLRRTQRDLVRPFRVPFSPVFPIIGIGLCIYLMTKLPGETWIRFVVWLLVGILIYFFYGR